MRQIKMSVPDSFQFSDHDLKIVLAGELYERGVLSLGQAADVADLSKRVFIELMGKFGYSLFAGKDEADLISDIENA